VQRQRTALKKGTLLAKYKARLDALDFTWDLIDTAWEEMFAELQRYRQEHGHCNVPVSESEDRVKIIWCQSVEISTANVIGPH
jgi:hypothetical protein